MITSHRKRARNGRKRGSIRIALKVTHGRAALARYYAATNGRFGGCALSHLECRYAQDLSERRQVAVEGAMPAKYSCK